MELRDLIVTPLLLIVIYAVAYVVRPYCTDHFTRKYFFPALTARIVGALAVGFIYQFYYHGGDTFAYHTHGSRHIWEAFMESPEKGVQLLYSNGEYGVGLWSTAGKIWYWRDPSSFFIIRIATVFDLLTFSSYSGTAVLFAVVAFIGSWLLFLTFCEIVHGHRKIVAICCLFIPSVIFWGSGIFKDTITLAALNVSTFLFYTVIIQRRIKIFKLLLLVLMLWIIYSVKLYILLCFIPCLLVWFIAARFRSIRSAVIQFAMFPLVVIFGIIMGYYAVVKVGEDDARYNLNRVVETARITAYDIRYGWGARYGQGSGYTLGEIDGTAVGMLKLIPPSINVTLFRPYLWEVKNPLMLLSAIEALFIFVCTAVLLWYSRLRAFRFATRPEILFCLSFSLMFSFAVGLSTSNFGTLSRYKIPMMPYYTLALVLIYSYAKKERKFSALEETE
jgi:hypothetical protein